MDEYVGLGPVEKRDPQAHISDPRGIIRGHSNGLTKREYFAAMAMQAILSRPINGVPELYSEVAALALKFADALIEELGK